MNTLSSRRREFRALSTWVLHGDEWSTLGSDSFSAGRSRHYTLGKSVSILQSIFVYCGKWIYNASAKKTNIGSADDNQSFVTNHLLCVISKLPISEVQNLETHLGVLLISKLDERNYSDFVQSNCKFEHCVPMWF